MYCVILLQSRRKIVVPSIWVQHKDKSFEPVKIFISSDKRAQPNFNLETYFFLQEKDGCYNGYCLKEFGKCFST